MKGTLAVLAGAVWLAFAGCQGPAVRLPVHVRGAWARATPEGARAGAIYMTLTSEVADSLIGVEVSREIADRAEMHETLGDASGRMSMHPVAGVELPAGEPVEFRPGGRHVMLMGLALPLAEGDTISVDLRLRHGGRLALRVPVRSGPGR